MALNFELLLLWFISISDIIRNFLTLLPYVCGMPIIIILVTSVFLQFLWKIELVKVVKAIL